MDATVPAGMGPGQMFTVTFPALNSNPISHATLQAEPMKNPAFQHAQDSTPAFSQALNSSYPEPMQPPSTHAEPVHAEAVPAPRTVTPPAPTVVSQSGQQSLLLVHVPPGVQPGSVIHVEIPNEGRTLAAQVPPGVQSFHVAYTPKQIHVPAQTPVLAHAAVPVPAPHHSPIQASSSPLGQTSGRQNLILVNVPPGCAAGTTLHVSVPNEPGRILAAVVPPGNVRQFHVSYEARGDNASSAQYGRLPPSSAFQQHQQQQPRNVNQNPYNRGNNNNNNNNRGGMMGNNNNNNRGGGMGNMMLPFIGGAAMGAVGAMTYDRFAHNSDAANSTVYGDGDRYAAGDDNGGGDYGGGDTGNYDNGGGGDYGGGDGGGDWGGDDYGGGDGGGDWGGDWGGDF
jgi:hypothetical protein